MLSVASRLVLASFLLVAPLPEPGQLVQIVVPGELLTDANYLVRVVYMGFALLMLLVFWRLKQFSPPLAAFCATVDLATAVTLLLLAGQSTPSSVLLFIFSIASAALRWVPQAQRRVIIGIVSLHLILALVSRVLAVSVSDMAPHYLNGAVSYLTSAGGIAALGLLIWYFAQVMERTRREKEILAGWPRTIVSEGALEILITTAASIFDAPRALLIWQEHHGGVYHIVYVNNGKVIIDVEEQVAFEPLTASALDGKHFLSLGNSDGQTLAYAEGEVLHWQGRPINRALREYFAIGNALCLSLQLDSIKGRLFILDRQDMSSDDLILGEIVARQVTSDLWQVQVQRRLQLAVANEERARLARDLHDGLLQSLTGLNLRLEALQLQLRIDPAEAAETLRQLQDSIVAEQRDLRRIVQKFKSTETTALLPENLSLTTRLKTLEKHVQASWGIETSIHIASDSLTLAPALQEEIYRIAQEALHNAGRHSQGTRIALYYRTDEREATLTVTDNGRGYSFKGRYDLRQMIQAGVGPVSLKNRIAALGGDLIIDSNSDGTRLTVRISLDETRELHG